MKAFSIFWIVLILIPSLARVQDSSRNAEREQMESEITRLREYLEKNEGLAKNVNLGSKWAELGFLYQVYYFSGVFIIN